MELKEALAEVQARQAHLRERRESALADLACIDGELKEAGDEEAVLSRLVTRHEGVEPAQAQEERAETADWRNLSRMKAVERALIEAHEPLGPPQVHQVLLDHGRDDHPNSVHAALGHLKIKHRATQADRGLWIPLSRANGQAAEVS